MNKRFIHPAADWILLALADGPLHGGAISSQIIGDTVGHYVHGTTLYRLIQELANEGLIEPISAAKAHGNASYRLTSRGRRRLLDQGSTWGRLSALVNQRLR